MKLGKRTPLQKGRGNMAWLTKEQVDAGYFIVKGPDSTGLYRVTGEHESQTVRVWQSHRVRPQMARDYCLYTMLEAIKNSS